MNKLGDLTVTWRQPCADGCERWPAGPDVLHSEELSLRKGLPPLLMNVAERQPEPVQWLGASFGLTQSLLSFWQRSGFRPVYLRQTPSDVTGASA